MVHLIWGVMAAPARPTDEDYADAVRFVLLGLASGEELDAVMRRIDQLHLPHNTFPAEVLLELAADAISESRATQAEPVEYEGIRDRYLPEYGFRGKRAQHMSHYALMAAPMIRAGIYPDLLDEADGWGIEDMWRYAFYALVVYVRIAAERSERSLEEVVTVLAEHRGLKLEITAP
jgi:hypothetical protein